MGICATAYLGYGFKVSNSLAEKIGEEKLKIKENFDINFHGDEENLAVIVCIKKSDRSITCYDELSKPIDINIKAEWDQQLQDYAKLLGVKNAKIGWWLCSSLG